MVSMELVTHSAPLNCQMQSTWIVRIGGENGVGEIAAIVVLIVADVPTAFVPGIFKVTSSSGKFVATNWSTASELDVFHWALRVSSMRCIAFAFAAWASSAFVADAVQ
jgi:hypothetical protein